MTITRINPQSFRVMDGDLQVAATTGRLAEKVADRVVALYDQGLVKDNMELALWIARNAK